MEYVNYGEIVMVIAGIVPEDRITVRAESSGKWLARELLPSQMQGKTKKYHNNKTKHYKITIQKQNNTNAKTTLIQNTKTPQNTKIQQIQTNATKQTKPIPNINSS